MNRTNNKPGWMAMSRIAARLHDLILRTIKQHPEWGSREVADHIGCSWHTVVRHAQKAGLKIRASRPTEDNRY